MAITQGKSAGQDKYLVHLMEIANIIFFLKARVSYFCLCFYFCRCSLFLIQISAQNSGRGTGEDIQTLQKLKLCGMLRSAGEYNNIKYISH